MDLLHLMDSLLSDGDGDLLETYTNRNFVINDQKKSLAQQDEIFGKRKKDMFTFTTYTTAGNSHRTTFSRPPPIWTGLLPTNRVNISDLKRYNDNVLHGKYFLCRNITRPFVMTSMMTVVDDPEGIHAVRLCLYNYTTCSATDDLTKVLPVGRILVIKHPWFKSTMDGGYSLRCDNPADVLVMEPKTFHEIFPQLSWKGSIPREFAPLQNDMEQATSEPTSEKSNLKKMGNEFFSQGRYLEALKSYSSCLNLAQNVTDDLDLLSNRAAVYLKLAWFSLALEDTETILSHDTTHIKGIFRKSKALCGLNKVTEALKFLIMNLTTFPKRSSNFNILASEIGKIDALKKQLDGEFDMVTLQDKLMANERLDYILEFKGPVEIVSIKGKGRGMVATKDFEPGQLILVSRAFELSFSGDKDKTHIELTVEEKEGSKIGHTPGHMNLIQSILQRVTHDPKSIPELYRLYAGPEKGFLELDNNGEHQVDMERIEAIVHYNAFEVGRNIETPTSQKDFNSGAGLWLLPSYINHSCFDNNVFHELYGDFFFVRAAKSIQKGQEILLYYIPTTEKYKVRKERLESYGFECTCSLCIFNKSELKSTLNTVDEIVDRNRHLKNKGLRNVEDLKWVAKSIATLKAIRINEKMNLELAQLYQLLGMYYFRNKNYKECIAELKNAHNILDGSSLVTMNCTLTYNIVCTYLLQGGKQNIRKARQWTTKMKNNFITAHGSLDVLRRKKGWHPGQDFESLLKENGIDLF